MSRIEKMQKKILQRTAEILKAHGIDFWLDSGTLLGVIRENQFPLLHKDVDIAIDAKHLKNLLALKKKFSPGYRLKKIFNISGRQWITGDVSRIVVLRFWDKDRSNCVKVNISLKFRNNDVYRWVDGRSCKSVDAHFFETLDSISVDGAKYPIPSDAQNYLAQRYGIWEAPERYWFGSIDDLSIAGKDQISSVSLIEKIKSRQSRETPPLAGKYLARMKKLLFRVQDVFDDIGVRYWIDDGTLLGIVRDGDLIPWDNDLDIGIDGKSVPLILKNRHRFLPRYWLENKTTDSPWIPVSSMSMKIKQPLEKIDKYLFKLTPVKISTLWEKVDLIIKYKMDDNYHWIDSNALKHIPRNFYDNLDQIKWEGRTFPVPSQVEKYLEIRYGNWRVPDKNFDPTLHDGTIAEKGF